MGVWGSYLCMEESGYHSESCCCAELRHRCHCHCLLLPPGQMAMGLMSRDDELAHLLPSITIKVANELSSIAQLGALNKLTFNYLCLHWSSFQQRLMGVSRVIRFTVQHGHPATGRKCKWVEEERQKHTVLIWDAPKWATAAVLPGCHVARSCQGEDALPGSQSSIGWLVNRDLLTGGGGLFWRGTPKR